MKECPREEIDKTQQRTPMIEAMVVDDRICRRLPLPAD